MKTVEQTNDKRNSTYTPELTNRQNLYVRDARFASSLMATLAHPKSGLRHGTVVGQYGRHTNSVGQKAQRSSITRRFWSDLVTGKTSGRTQKLGKKSSAGKIPCLPARPNLSATFVWDLCFLLNKL